ncbi:MAG: hypothetical protein KJ620_10090 [Candidatus Edwardsbacteria bacterium]|nr:hypothetical protein [Candidatus Edwardsbacteria bacterium]MBU1577412.1 hypothetical protein [Candidatus Edwardsbacteria bacterium]MBU2462786.1 hypothetical protein [Candidatus Edwardsbacteria bacterium]MBU2592979.1 hypothetical protein [Candidatus Edwardsbacteria bacterium]
MNKKIIFTLACFLLIGCNKNLKYRVYDNKVNVLCEIPLQKEPYNLGNIVADEFVYPEGFAVDTSALYIFDYGNDRICKIDWQGNFLAFIKKQKNTSIWLKPDKSIQVSCFENLVNYFKSTKKYEKLIEIAMRYDTIKEINNTPYSPSYWNIDTKNNLLNVLEDGHKLITFDLKGTEVTTKELSPRLPIKITKEDTTGGYQHKVVTQITLNNPTDEIEYYLGRTGTGNYIFASLYDSQKLFIFNPNGILDKIEDIAVFLNERHFIISGNFQDPGIDYILHNNKIIIKVTGNKSILFLEYER